MRNFCIATILTLAASLAAAAQNSHQASLSCTPSTSSGVTGYEFFRATTSGGYNYSTPLNSTPVTACAFVDGPSTTFIEGATYYYVARAIGTGGTPSINSNEVTAVIPVTPPPAPLPPTNLTASPK